MFYISVSVFYPSGSTETLSLKKLLQLFPERQPHRPPSPLKQQKGERYEINHFYFLGNGLLQDEF